MFFWFQAEDVLALVQHFRNALLRQSPHFTVAFGASSVLLPHVLAFRVHAAPCVAPADESLTANIGMKDTTAFQFLLARQLQSWCAPLHLECEVLPSTLAPTVAVEFDPVVAVQPSPAIFDASNPSESATNKLSRRMDSAIFQVPALAVAPSLVDETPRERSAGWFVFRPALWPQRRSDDAAQPSFFGRTAALIDAFVDALTLHVQLLSRCVELRPHFERALLASSPDFEIVPFAELAHSEEVLASEQQRQANDFSVPPVPLIGLGAFRSVPALLAMRPAPVAHQGGQRSATPTFDGDPILDVFNDALATALFNIDGSTLFRVAETRGGALCIVISAQLPIESPSSLESRPATALSAASVQPEQMACNGVISALESNYVSALVAFIEHTARHLDLPPAVAHAMETALQRGIREAEARLQSLASTAVTPALPSHDSATRSTGGLGQIVSSVWSWFAPAAPADPAVSSVDAAEQGAAPIAGATGQHFDIRFGFDTPIGASDKSAPVIGASSSKVPAS